jgi:aminopeptidase N
MVYQKIVMAIMTLVFANHLLYSQQITESTHNCKHHKSSLVQHKTKFKGSFKSANTVSDSIDIIKYTIFLDATDFNTFTTKSICSIDFEALVDNIAILPLDLKGQTVDSVVHSSGLLDFNHVGEKLKIELESVLSLGQMDQITVHYHGGAVIDPSGFGGFYFNSDIAYNIGVAFTDIPHNYGRVWFPCFDNFVEKSLYEFQILTPLNRMAYCNGHLLSTDSIAPNIRQSNWILNREIPTYLASVAISTYERYETSFLSISGDSIPVYLVAKPVNLNTLVNSFSNLEAVFNAFENWFGPYQMERIGYVLTPVGAMEHSTNIAFPVSLAGGGFQSESVMAHELAHEWFGNLVTCKTAEDMWLNEGWAEYLSLLVYEVLESPEFYSDLIRNNHREMLHKAHYSDGGFLTMNNIPLDVTYGDHVYNKGADMAHTLRGYLGDELFFDGLKAYLEEFAFKSADSYDFRDFLNSIDGIDVTDYFEDWIFQPGWTQFSIDDVSFTGSGNDYSVDLEVTQRLRYANNFYNNVPATLTLWDADLNIFETQVVLSGETTQLNVNAPFEPVLWTLNRDEKISYGLTAEEGTFTTTGLNVFTHAFFRITINEIENPAFLRVENFWAGPGGEVENNAYLVSPDRYWRISGITEGNFSASGRVDFDGRNTGSGNLDPLLLAAGGSEFDESLVVLLYRSTPNEPWQNWEDISIQSLGSTTDGYARITINSLPLGEYTFGIPNPEVSVDELSADFTFEIYPNPAQNFVTISTDNEIAKNGSITIFDIEGRIVLTQSISGNSTILNTTNFAKGQYVVQLQNESAIIGKRQLIIN